MNTFFRIKNAEVASYDTKTKRFLIGFEAKNIEWKPETLKEFKTWIENILPHMATSHHEFFHPKIEIETLDL